MSVDSTDISHERPGPRARLGDALTGGVRESWDRLGLTVSSSLIWTVLLTVTMTGTAALSHLLSPWCRLPLYATLPALCMSAPTAGLCYVAHLALAHEETSWLEMLRGAARFGAVATRAGLYMSVAGGLLAVNLWFYLRIGSLLSIAAAILCLYVGLVFGAIACYLGPAIVAQELGVFDEPERKARRGAFAAIRRSFFLALGSPLFTLGLLIVQTAMIIAAAATAVVFAIAWAVTSAMIATAALNALLKQHSILATAVDEPVTPDEEFHIAVR